MDPLSQVSAAFAAAFQNQAAVVQERVNKTTTAAALAGAQHADDTQAGQVAAAEQVYESSVQAALTLAASLLPNNPQPAPTPTPTPDPAPPAPPTPPPANSPAT